jgi:hypothetical protein
MKGTYANIVWHAFVVYGLLSEGFKRHTSQDWESISDVRIKYDVIFGSLVIFLVICIIGLIYKKK